jgi:hypothetical protein
MNKSYVIQWKSRINGRFGKGTNRFDLEDAERLAEELNREYPAIHHEVAEAEPRLEVYQEDTTFNKQPELATESPQINHHPHHALAFE